MSAIGDTILTTPVACRLRERFPKAFIAWAVEEKSAQFVKGHPAIDEVVVLPRGWFVSPPKVLALSKRLRGMTFDAAIDCQSITKTALACYASGAPLRVGCKGKYGAELSPWLNNRLVRPRTRHLTDRSLELLAPLGIPHAEGSAVGWRLPRDVAAERRVESWVASRLGSGAVGAGYAVVNPGATWDSKLWDMERFGAVAARLGERRGLRSLVVWGGARERAWADRIAAASGGWATVAEPTSLSELAALLRQARLMLSADTGPLHLAVAVGAPTVGLYGATNPEDCGPYGEPHAAVIKLRHEGGRRERRNANNRAMLQISTDDAWQACETVLCRTASRFPAQPRLMAS
ncbi:MAG: glycosyltransferase family 9 protein [Lacipirellulaceae bacterium]